MLNKERTFSAEQCDALFAAVLAHDDIDLGAQLPETISLDYTPDQIGRAHV